LIVLDTNVISALMRRDADPAVVAWLDRQAIRSVWTTAVTIFEIRLGLERLELNSSTRRALELEFTAAVDTDLGGRVLHFDTAAAHAAAALAARRRAAGRPTEIRDSQIAGIVAAHQAALATRNTRDFDQIGLDLIDPWTA